MSEKNATGQECDAAGNVQRAAAIFLEYGEFIRSVIRYKIHDKSRAEDLFHDFFLSLVSIPIPAEVKDVKGYIYRAIINDITDHFRWLQRYQKITKKYYNFDKIAVNNQPCLDALIEKEQTDRMIELIKKRVTRTEFEAIASRYCDDLPIGQAAEKMSINSRSISRYVSTGLRKVKQFLTVKQETENESATL